MIAADRELRLLGGTLSGLGLLTIECRWEWSGGTLDRGGEVIVAPTGRCEITGPFNKYFYGGTPRNEGKLFWTQGALFSVLNPATLVNVTGAIAEFRGSGTWSGSFGRIENAGLLRKTGGAAQLQLGGTFINSGSFEAEDGTVNLQGSFTQTLGHTLLASSSLDFNPATSRVDGGSLRGIGSIESLNFNNGTNAPGDGVGGGPVGRLRFSANVQFGSTAIVEIDLGGPVPGTGHDQILVEASPGSAQLGVATLNGLLRARLVNAYDPPVGTRLTVLQSRQRTGTFANVDLPPGFFIEYTASDVIVRRDSAPGGQHGAGDCRGRSAGPVCGTSLESRPASY